MTISGSGNPYCPECGKEMRWITDEGLDGDYETEWDCDTCHIEVIKRWGSVYSGGDRNG